MNKIDSVHADLSKIFNNLDDFLQFEEKSEVYVFEYETKTYLATKVISSDTQFIIHVKKGNKVDEITIDSPEENPKVFKINNASSIAFVPVDGQLLKLGSYGYHGRRCDFIFFDNNNFCFVEFKLNAISKSSQTIRDNREDASNQLGDTIEFFNQKFLEYFKQTFIDFYQDINLEAYICTPKFYERFPSRNTNGEFFLVDFYDKHQIALFEA